MSDTTQSTETPEQTRIKAQVEDQRTVSDTLLAEEKSDHWFVRSWRPFFGYVVSLAWLIQMVGITVFLFINAPIAVQAIIALGQLGFMWAGALSVLGVYVHHRTKEKMAGVAGANTQSPWVAMARSLLQKAGLSKLANLA